MLHGRIEGEPGGESLAPRAERQRTVLVNAAVTQGGRDGLCRIRNVSEGGLAIETSLPLSPGPAEIALRSGDVLACIVRWAREGRAGFSCEAGVDATRLVGRRMAAEYEQPGCGFPRFQRSQELKIAVRGHPYDSLLHSIAPTDVWLASAPEFPRGEPLTVSIRGLGDVSARVCAAENGEMIALFNAPLPFRDLDPWLARTVPPQGRSQS